ncbi:hypothetical protein ACFLR1_07310 [Bacteroidota bacterium]
MMKKISFYIFCLCLLSSVSFAQSAYFFKTSEALEAEKWDALESSNSVMSTEITKELNSRTKAYERIEQLEADLDKKLAAEDYFEAETIKKELELLKANQVKAKQLRENIEASLAIEDYEKAAQYKTALVDLNKPAIKKTPQTVGVNKTETLGNGGVKKTTSGFKTTGGLQGAFVAINTSQSSTNTDKWGRTASENLNLYKKKRVKGAVLMGVSGVLFITGGSLIGASLVDDDEAYRIAGVLSAAAGLGLFIPGVVILATAKKYKKRANQLANGTASLSPSLMNIRSYSGSSVNSQAGYGLAVSYRF